jgi:hypothetical protein
MSVPMHVKQFEEQGYLVLNTAISFDQIEMFWAEVEANISTNPDLSVARYGELLKNRDVAGKLMQDDLVLRIIDLEDHSKAARDLMLHSAITDFLAGYYGVMPTVIQTLTYKYSSQQGAHVMTH